MHGRTLLVRYKMSFILSTSAAAFQAAGEGETVSDDSASSALIEGFSNNAEGDFIADTRIDWLDKFSALSTNAKTVIASGVTDLIAMDIISWSLKGYSSVREAELLMDKLDSHYRKVVGNIKDQNTKTFLGVT